MRRPRNSENPGESRVLAKIFYSMGVVGLIAGAQWLPNA